MSDTPNRVQFKLHFTNPYLDKLRLNDWPDYLMRLRLELALSRAELAKILGLSPHTIRKYESNWSGRKLPPKWYEIVLRLMCGDLSTFGSRWDDTRIRYDSHKITSPYFSEPMDPTDMNSQYSRIASHYEQTIRRLNQELNTSRLRHNELLADYRKLELKLSEIEQTLAQRNAQEQAKASGKVIDLFARNK